MDKHIPVLIVGAGPTGLLLAAELSRRGVSFRIIDKKPERTLASNATWMQTRTLELLDQLGIVTRFLKAGHPCHAINLYLAGKILTTLPIDQIDSTYPYILMLPQSHTERLLIDYLNEAKVHVERSLELIDVQQENGIVTARVKSKGIMQTMTCDWLIGCDGANSVVRQKCKIVFPGEDITEQFMVADGKIDSFMSKDEIHVFFDEGTVFAASPLGMNKYRLAANIHQSHPRQNFYEKEVVEMVQERGYGSYYVSDISWVSPFWIHGKIAEQMSQGSVFLAGDAAHIHAPLGGQGMNAGMQDAFNLAWKLALVIKGKAKAALLESYHAERYPVVKEIVAQAESFTKMVLFDPSFLTKLREFSDKIIEGDKPLIEHVSTMLSQIGIEYHKSPLIQYENAVSSASPQPGARVPDVKINKSTRLYHYFRHAEHTVLLFMGDGVDNLEEMITLQQWLVKTYSGLIKVYLVSKEEIKETEDLIVDSENAIFTHFKLEKPAVYIIRPDTYIGYCSSNLEKSAIGKYFTRLSVTI